MNAPIPHVSTISAPPFFDSVFVAVQAATSVVDHVSSNMMPPDFRRGAFCLELRIVVEVVDVDVVVGETEGGFGDDVGLVGWGVVEGGGGDFCRQIEFVSSVIDLCPDCVSHFVNPPLF